MQFVTCQRCAETAEGVEAMFMVETLGDRRHIALDDDSEARE